MEWKEFKKLWKGRKLYTQQKKITEEGIHFSEKDFLDFIHFVEQDVRKKLKKLSEDYELQ